MDILRVAIIGCGAIAANRHIPSLLASPNAVFYGCYRDSIGAAMQYSVKLYNSEDELYADPNVDAVIIGSPTKAHAEQAIKAMAAL